MAKHYQLRNPETEACPDLFVVLDGRDSSFEVLFESEVIAKRAAELLSEDRTFGEGLLSTKYPSLYVFTLKERRDITCRTCDGNFLLVTDKGFCAQCNNTGIRKVEIEVLDTKRPEGFEDRGLLQLKDAIGKEIDGEIGFNRHEDCPDKTTGNHIGYNGICESCPLLMREEIPVLSDDGIPIGVAGHRWMCRKRREEVKLAEKLMGERAGNEVP